MAQRPIFEGYPFDNGKIPPNVTEIESVGEACHDFTMERSELSVVNLRKQFITFLDLNKYEKTEEYISKLLHSQFNGNGLVKVNLDLSDASKVYTNPAALERVLFTDETNVNPHVFTISSSDLVRFQGLFNNLKTRLQRKYGLLPAVTGKLQITHDAYKRDGLLGNPLDSEIIYSAASICDSGVSGSSASDIAKALANNTFELTDDLVKGESQWGNWEIKTIKDVTYKHALISIKLKNLPGKQATVGFNLIIPRNVTRGPSVNELSIMLNGIISGKSEDTILNLIGRSMNGVLSGNLREFYRKFIAKIEELYKIDPYYALMFILIFKEMGDMSQHMVAVKYKHLAGGSVDRLSTVAFLKRGVPISYIIVSIKGLDHVRFRVAGTYHIQGGMTEEEFIAQQQAKAAALKAAQVAMQLEKERRRDAAKLRAIIKAQENRESLARVRTMLPAQAAAARAARAARGHAGGSRNQSGGVNFTTDEIINILVNQLFNYLFNVISFIESGRPIPPGCSLFNLMDIPEDLTLLDNYIDLTLIVEKGEYKVLLDNRLLGLPLASILYKLQNTLDSGARTFTKDETEVIIYEFLRGFNFEKGEIDTILICPALDIRVNNEPSIDIMRPMTDADKHYIQYNVDNYGAIVPGFHPTPMSFLRESHKADRVSTPEKKIGPKAAYGSRRTSTHKLKVDTKTIHKASHRLGTHRSHYPTHSKAKPKLPNPRNLARRLDMVRESASISGGSLSGRRIRYTRRKNKNK